MLQRVLLFAPPGFPHALFSYILLAVHDRSSSRLDMTRVRCPRAPQVHAHAAGDAHDRRGLARVLRGRLRGRRAARRGRAAPRGPEPPRVPPRAARVVVNDVCNRPSQIVLHFVSDDRKVAYLSSAFRVVVLAALYKDRLTTARPDQPVGTMRATRWGVGNTVGCQLQRWLPPPFLGARHPFPQLQNPIINPRTHSAPPRTPPFS